MRISEPSFTTSRAPDSNSTMPRRGRMSLIPLSLQDSGKNFQSVLFSKCCNISTYSKSVPPISANLCTYGSATSSSFLYTSAFFDMGSNHKLSSGECSVLLITPHSLLKQSAILLVSPPTWIGLKLKYCALSNILWSLLFSTSHSGFPNKSKSPKAYE